MNYEQILERIPKTVTAGDKRIAGAFVEFLEQVFADERMMTALTTSNKNYLYKLRKIWAARADGTDEAWLVKGSAPGRPRSRDIVKRRHEDDDDETMDDLSRRLVKRYRGITPEVPGGRS